MENETPSKYVDPGAAALKWSLYILFALCVAISLTGCNTFAGGAKLVKGIGDDIETLALGTKAWLNNEDSDGE